MNRKPRRGAEAVGVAKGPASAHWRTPHDNGTEDHPGKVRLLELAKQLGNVSQACKVMGYSLDRPGNEKMIPA